MSVTDEIDEEEEVSDEVDDEEEEEDENEEDENEEEAEEGIQDISENPEQALTTEDNEEQFKSTNSEMFQEQFDDDDGVLEKEYYDEDMAPSADEAGSVQKKKILKKEVNGEITYSSKLTKRQQNLMRKHQVSKQVESAELLELPQKVALRFPRWLSRPSCSGPPT